MATQLYTGTLVVMDCCNCGMTFGVDSTFDRRNRDDGGSFHCPRGHAQHYTTTTVQKLKDEKEAVERRLIRTRAQLDQANADFKHQQATARGYKGALAKSKKRAAAGVCPAPGCKRHFANVHAHVVRMHPDLVEEVS